MMVVAAIMAQQFPEHSKGCPSAAAARMDWGCDEETPAERPAFELGDVEYFRCPLQYLDADMIGLVELWSWATRQALPERGGVLDQPAILMDAIRTLDVELASYAPEKPGEEQSGE